MSTVYFVELVNDQSLDSSLQLSTKHAPSVPYHRLRHGILQNFVMSLPAHAEKRTLKCIPTTLRPAGPPTFMALALRIVLLAVRPELVALVSSQG